MIARPSIAADLAALSGTVSVVIPARDSARFLAEALASVSAQEPPPGEVIVVDDGSTDATAEIAAATPAVIVQRQPPTGVSAARNAGVERSRGDWIAFLDADDLWLPGKLACQLAAVASEPDLDGVFCHLRNEFTEPELTRRLAAAEGVLPGIHVSTLLVRRAAFRAVGGFDPTRVTIEFADWYARARDAGLRFRVLEMLGVVRRVHGANASLGLRSEYARFARRRIEELRRRRSGVGRQDGEC